MTEPNYYYNTNARLEKVNYASTQKALPLNQHRTVTILISRSTIFALHQSSFFTTIAKNSNTYSLASDLGTGSVYTCHVFAVEVHNEHKESASLFSNGL